VWRIVGLAILALTLFGIGAGLTIWWQAQSDAYAHGVMDGE
jgi:hypothetical protein